MNTFYDVQEWDRAQKRASYHRKKIDNSPKKIIVRSEKIVCTCKHFILRPGVSHNENLRYPRFFKENVSTPNEIYRHHQTKFDFFYITPIRPPPKSKKAFNFSRKIYYE